MNNYWFVTFGDMRLKEARCRIRCQAEKMGVFGSRIRIFSEKDLSRDFCEKMGDRLVPGSRGFGYWCWKPHIISCVLDEMPEGDVLLYADIGCHLNIKGLKRLEEYKRFAIEHGVVAFQFRALGDRAVFDYSSHFYPEKQWTKMDAAVHFNAVCSDILDSGQVQACVIVMHNTRFVRNFIKVWESCYFEHFELVDDTPSVVKNDSMFVENRHDQSIFSLLCKKNGAYLLSCGEIEHIRQHMPNGADKRYWPDYWRELMQYPVHARRDLGKYTKLVECPDWLKPILGKYGRRFASRIYETIKPFIKRDAIY